MKLRNGQILLVIACLHIVFALTPLTFGKQFLGFTESYFFKISEGLLDLPIFNGQPNYENFAAFWFFYFGLLLLPLGILVDYIEKEQKPLPKQFLWTYLIVVLVGVYMIPLSGMTFLMLPHALYMLIKSRNAKIV